LGTISAGFPLEKPDSMPLLIQPALLPASLEEKPNAAVRWWSGLQALLQSELPVLVHPVRIRLPDPLRTAGVLEAHPLRAWETGSFAGFQAPVNMADSIRETRIAQIKDGRDDAGLGLGRGGPQVELSGKPGAIEVLDAYRVGVLQAYAADLHWVRERRPDPRSPPGGDVPIMERPAAAPRDHLFGIIPIWRDSSYTFGWATWAPRAT